MEQEKAKEIIKYLKKNSLRLLFLAVLITSMYSLKFAAYGKYVDYLNDNSSAVAGYYCFASGDLTDEDTNTELRISSFNKHEISLAFDIRNYENSYYFNKAGLDIYYYVQVEVFSDKDYTEPSTYDYDTTIQYGTEDGAVAAQIMGLRLDNGAYNKAQGDDIPNNVAILKGMPSSKYEKASGRTSVAVNINWKDTVTETQYVHIIARTVPTYEADTLLPLEDQDGNKHYGSTDPMVYSYGAPDPEEYKQSNGIFDKVLDVKYILNVTGSEATDDLVGLITRQSSDNYAITYSVSNPTEIAMSANIFFNPERLTPDNSIGNVQEEYEDGKLVRCYVVTEAILEKGSQDFYFYKKSLYDNITYGEEKDNPDIYLKVIPKADD